MTRPLRAPICRSVLIAFAFFFVNGCPAFKAAINDDQPDHPDTLAEKQTAFPAGMLTSLEIVVDACPVFLDPEKNSLTFGPLIRGEVVKRLDGRGNWFCVWIPRLRISGWILQSDAAEILDTDPSQPPIPERELTTLIVVSEKINVRKGPATKSEVILVAAKNDEFLLLGEREGWFRVWVPKQSRMGWIFNKGVVRKTRK